MSLLKRLRTSALVDLAFAVLAAALVNLAFACEDYLLAGLNAVMCFFAVSEFWRKVGGIK